MLVGPDNGLLSLAWERCGGADEAVDVTRSPHRLEPVSATFHGRDLFAPVAAAPGRRRARSPTPASPSTPTSSRALELPEPRRRGRRAGARTRSWSTASATSALERGPRATWRAPASRSARSVEIEVGRRAHAATYAQTFADVKPGELLVYEDAYRALALAINRGDAAGALGLDAGRPRCACARDDRLGRPRPPPRSPTRPTSAPGSWPRAGAPHGTLVTADEQTAGRGRQGRAWIGAAGRALLMSLLAARARRAHALLPLAAAVAVCEARGRRLRARDQVAQRRLDRAAASWRAS